MDPSAQDLHNRAFESAKETRQHLTTMATGSLGVFFLAITGGSTGLSEIEKYLLFVAIFTMATTIFFGVLGAYADAQWSYYWAKQIEEEKLGRPVHERLANRRYWHRVKRWTEIAMMWSFAIGILVSCTFIFERSERPKGNTTTSHEFVLRKFNIG